MLKFIPILKSEEIKPDGGSAGGTPPVPKPAEAAPKPQVAPPAPPAQGEGSFDEFGYAIPAETKGDAGKEGKTAPKPEQKTDEKKVENPVTGYGEEPPKVEEPPVVPAAPAAPAAPAETDLGFELNADGLSPEEVKAHKEFIKKHGVTKEVAQAFMDQRKEEIKQAAKFEQDAEKEFQKRVQQTRADWHKELKADPTFGGDKFAFNVQRVERVLEEFMPNTKKQLTERKIMPAPYLMRDLASMADTLYETTRLVQGEPNVPSEEATEKENDPLAFYNQKG